MQDKNRITHIASLAAFAAIAIIFGYVEALIPLNFGIPGVKLGVANLVILIMMYRTHAACSFGDMLAVDIVRIVIVGFLFGNMYGIIYSLCGGVVSLVFMYILKRSNCLGMIGVSIIGGVTHNLAQLIVAMIVVDQLKIVFYAPVLLLSGTICGCLLGVIGNLIVIRLNSFRG